ncbi:Swt1 family HEPN domain-containing protein [Roseateles violae]|uniref:Swt1 family HEPN domain-containing protein n=1 Tax=Roseateles violae TaxID=3058042 RepID=A0ABT8DLJ3_9BURK|nr:Swt1 family HEPN domain-containing protein [Pelomonas sp. PFR6]MDN3918846.1 Swt1 family HEPN domain-containing protein [Pelomonas sp. PFR6]
MLSEDLSRIARMHGVEFGHMPTVPQTVEDVYYPQFDAAVRAEAAAMAKHYEVFYSLEKSIRELVAQTIEAAEKREDWWASTRVPSNIQADVASRIQKELDAGVTRRSLDELDYTTFGELSVIIAANWDIFGGLFNSKKAVEKVMASLNALRNPIAHCSPLAEDEELRLQLTVRDWFRLME